jgi:hypothetical protein
MIDAKIFEAARNGRTKEERDKAIKILADDGYCTHYPGYTCDRDFPKACPACIKRCFDLEKARAARLYSVPPGEKGE